MRWAFWRGPDPGTHRALPDDVGLPTTPRPPAAARAAQDPDERTTSPPAPTSGATPTDRPPAPAPAPPPTSPAPDLDRAALAAAGTDLARIVVGTGQSAPTVDARTLAAAATAALAARLPGLAGVGEVDEPADELLHAYAELLVTRTERRTAVPRDELLTVARAAAAAAAVGGADDPALLLLADLPVGDQLAAAAALLARTAADGAGAPDELAAEVRALFRR